MTAPSFVNVGTYTTGTATSVTPSLPASRVNGNLLVAYARFSGSTSAVTWTLPTGWTSLDSLNQGGTRPCLVCYRFVDGTETAPVFNHNVAANTIAGQVIQYSGVYSGGPIGSKTESSTVASPMTLSAIASTAIDSVAINLLIVNNSTAAGVSSGFTSDSTTNSASGSPTISHLAFASPVGSSSGGTSVTNSAANLSYFMFEIRSQAPPAAVGSGAFSLMGMG